MPQGKASTATRSKQSPEVAVLPQWTKFVVTDLGGRDPLGLSRISQMLTDDLLSGITTQTDRARYYGLYTWSLWHIQRHEQPTDFDTFTDAFQRREAAIALATMLADPTASPVGKRTVGPRLDQARHEGIANTAFQVLPSNRLGGFGQYYGGCLYHLGLTHRPEGGADQVTQKGAALATVFNTSLANVPYVAKGLFEKPKFDFEVLQDSAERLSIDAITQPFAKAEREALIALLFAFDDQSSSATQRRTTLAHILFNVSLYASKRVPIDAKNPSVQLVYAPTYYDVLLEPDGKARTASWPAKFDICRRYWRQFCLHQYFTVALETALVAVLDSVSGSVDGMPMPELVARLSDRSLREAVSSLVGKPCRSPNALLREIGVEGVPVEGNPTLPSASVWADPLCEASLTADASGSPEQRMARVVTTLAVLYRKWRGMRGDPVYVDVAHRSGGDPCAASFLPNLDCWTDAATSWHDAIEQLIRHALLDRHDVVMYSKGRLDSCWVRRDGERVAKAQDCRPYQRSSRHRQAVRILADLGLLELKDEQVLPTEAGAEVLRQCLEGEP
jgi:hypothetical protein